MYQVLQRGVIVAVSCLALLGGCAGEEPVVDPAATPEGRLCGRAYSSWVDSLKDESTKRGVALPTMPDKKAYIETCVANGFSEEQARCLDPKLRSLDAEGCAAALGPMKEKQEALDKLFVDSFSPKADEPAEPAEAAAGDDAAKVEGALGQ